MYERFIAELKSYSKAIRILSKGYLPISLIPPCKLEAILLQVEMALTKMNKDYDLVLNRLHLYYDMKLVMFGIDNQRNLIIQFPIFVQPYTQTKLTLYQIEIVPIPILDANNKTQSYTQLQVEKPYIALNEETYISLCPQELNICKRIGYGYFCEELFVVKSKHKNSCASAVYFNLEHEIKQNCEFQFYFNKTDITPSVLDGGHQIILVKLPSYTRIICTHNNNIPVNIPSHPYVLLDRSILCSCDIEAKGNFLLESLATCGEQEKPDLEMYFTINLAFANYLNQLNETINIPIERNWTHQTQVLPISIKAFNMSPNLLQAPKTLKEYINQYQEIRKLIDIKENTIKKPTFHVFLSSYIADVIVFVTGILSVILTFVIAYMLCGQSKLKSLVANMALQYVKTIEAAAIKEIENSDLGIIKILVTLNLVITVLLILIKIKKSRVFQGHLFTNMVKVNLFLAYTQSYVPLELNSAAGNVQLFKLTGALLIERFTLKKGWIWDVLEVNWSDIHETLGEKEVNLPGTLTIPLNYKLKVRKLFNERSSMHVYIMLKYRKAWNNLENDRD